MVPFLPVDSPLPLLAAALFCVALLRAGATYGIARSARHALRRRAWSQRPRVARAEGLVARYGAAAVTLCFLTVGIQTAVNAAAGSLRMPLLRYLPALVLGAALWAALYTTLGLAVVQTGTRGLTIAVVVAGLVAAGLALRARPGLDAGAA
jgi:membrane protein DedA with SNARE-associated domain